MNICFFGNGLNVHLQRLARGLAARGHRVHLVTHKPLPITDVTVERFSVPPVSVYFPHRWHRRRDQYLRHFLESFDVVVQFFLHDWGFTPEILQCGCFIASPRGSDIVCPPGEGPPSDDLIETRKTLLRHASAVGVAGPAFTKVVRNFADLDPGAIFPLPLGVDTDLFYPYRFRSENLTASPSASSHIDLEPRIGFFKGFREVYGAEYLVRAIPDVLAEFPTAKFEFVGDGPQCEPCRILALEMSVDKSCTWVPRQPHDLLPQRLNRWDLVVIPSLCESFGVAALEASAMELPIVATRVCGFQDTVVDGETGVLVPPKSPTDLANAIIALLQSSPKRREMGLAGRAFVTATYEWDTVLEQWESSLSVAQQGQNSSAVAVHGVA